MKRLLLILVVALFGFAAQSAYAQNEGVEDWPVQNVPEAQCAYTEDECGVATECVAEATDVACTDSTNYPVVASRAIPLSFMWLITLFVVVPALIIVIIVNKVKQRNRDNGSEELAMLIKENERLRRESEIARLKEENERLRNNLK